MEKLSHEVVRKRLSNLQGWTFSDEKWITKKYRFRNYLNGITFVNEVAQLSEKVNHHPFITIEYVLITIKLSSWRANGLTELDLQLAEDYDELFNHIKMREKN